MKNNIDKALTDVNQNARFFGEKLASACFGLSQITYNEAVEKTASDIVSNLIQKEAGLTDQQLEYLSSLPPHKKDALMNSALDYANRQTQDYVGTPEFNQRVENGTQPLTTKQKMVGGGIFGLGGAMLGTGVAAPIAAEFIEDHPMGASGALGAAAIAGGVLGAKWALNTMKDMNRAESMKEVAEGYGTDKINQYMGPAIDEQMKSASEIIAGILVKEAATADDITKSRSDINNEYHSDYPNWARGARISHSFEPQFKDDSIDYKLKSTGRANQADTTLTARSYYEDPILTDKDESEVGEYQNRIGNAIGGIQQAYDDNAHLPGRGVQIGSALGIVAGTALGKYLGGHPGAWKGAIGGGLGGAAIGGIGGMLAQESHADDARDNVLKQLTPDEIDYLVKFKNQQAYAHAQDANNADKVFAERVITKEVPAKHASQVINELYKEASVK